VRAGHVLAEQLRAEPLFRAAQLRPPERDRACRRLDRRFAVAVTHPGLRVIGQRRTGVTLAAEEVGNLGLQRRLQEQLRAEPGNRLDRARKVTPLGEHGIYLVSQHLGRRYSFRHGRSPSTPRIGLLERNLRPFHIYTARETRPPRTPRDSCTSS